MSPADSTDPSRGVFVQKPRSDIYTVMLAISLASLLIGCIVLALELRAYG